MQPRRPGWGPLWVSASRATLLLLKAGLPNGSFPLPNRSMSRCPLARTLSNLPRAPCTTSAGPRTPTAGCTSWSIGPTRYPVCWPRPPAPGRAWACPCPRALSRRSERRERPRHKALLPAGKARRSSRRSLQALPGMHLHATWQSPSPRCRSFYSCESKRKDDPPTNSMLAAREHSTRSTKKNGVRGVDGQARCWVRFWPGARRAVQTDSRGGTFQATPNPRPPAWSCRC